MRQEKFGLDEEYMTQEKNNSNYKLKGLFKYEGQSNSKSIFY